MARRIITPEVGQVYRCAAAPSGYILVDRVGDSPVIGQVVAGWGDAHGHTASHRVVVEWKRLRNTTRRGPFSAVIQTRALS